MSRRRSGRKRAAAVAGYFAVLVAVVVLAWPQRAAAWAFAEHMEMGARGYAEACKLVAADHKFDGGKEVCENATDPIRVRWCLACRVYTPALYGQSVAISGDQVGSPEALMSVAGQRAVNSLASYAFLALVNAAHYQPNSPRNWRTFHDRALEAATAKHDGGAMAVDFAKAFYTSAFADHFLQDAFAAGHAGFNRAGSSAGASKAFHDIWNNAGRLVKAPTGKCWLQYGDHKWRYMPAEFGQKQLNQAELFSVHDVLSAFVTGRRDGAREVKPLYFMPIATTTDTLAKGIAATEGGGDIEGVWSTEKINDIYWAQKAKESACDTKTVPIDGLYRDAVLSAGVDYWGKWKFDRDTTVLSVDVTFSHLLTIPLAFDLGVSPLAVVRRNDQTRYAPGAFVGLLAPPIYLFHGSWRNEIGVQATTHVLVEDSVGYSAYASLFLRSSVEAENTIVRLQAGPTYDMRTQAWGATVAVGLEFASLRWVRGGGSIGTR